MPAPPTGRRSSSQYLRYAVTAKRKTSTVCMDSKLTNQDASQLLTVDYTFAQLVYVQVLQNPKKQTCGGPELHVIRG
jgi:hypothetical protein